MNEKKFKNRTKAIGVQVIQLVNQLPRSLSVDVISRQVIRSSTSIGANYRASCRAKSLSDRINKLKIVEEEADETMFWLEILVDTNMVESTKVKNLHQETNEIVAMVVSSINTLRSKQR